MRKTHHLAQIIIDEYLHVGDTAIDATIKAGDVTRFLASRVGDGGHVLSFSDQKNEIDDMAASLFLSGLTARVEPIEKNFTQIINYLDPNEPIAVILFQIDTQIDAGSLVQTIRQLQLYLRNHGLIVLDGHTNDEAMVTVAAYAQTLSAETYSVQQFNDLLSNEAALLIQRN
ncbi:hypothetical protein H9L19_03060 [Weissella diestrammenae]|uniref:Uncharacterized protein n=1 Tax=Weissella diestrammenae TaxID=1162633 RepID=A0A7G9T6X8_9LACO|nr:hypothetical protein [Weissella diestrammenae]MCM0582552.1 hypothetical protein [Weissella diestrammenae]QNN75853.1 hypothetical protein H9L19_03060 [Weissella diestrammenae]